MDAQSAANLAFHPAGSGTGPSDLVEAALRLDTDALVAMLDAHISVHGVVDTWDGLCGPALNELGGGTVDVDNYVDVVHLLSWAITVSLHRVTIAARPPRPPVLLACPADEHHVLPLEALRAALAERDVPANLLGANLPDAALRGALRRVDPPPAALVLWAHSPGTAHTMLTRGRTRSRLVLAGPGWPAGSERPVSPRSPTRSSCSRREPQRRARMLCSMPFCHPDMVVVSTSVYPASSSRRRNREASSKSVTLRHRCR